MPFTLTLDKFYSSRFLLCLPFSLLTGNDFKRSIRYYMHNESAKLAVRYNRLQFLFEASKLYCVTGIWRSLRTVPFSYLTSLGGIDKVTWLMHNSFLSSLFISKAHLFFHKEMVNGVFCSNGFLPIHCYALCKFAVK